MTNETINIVVWSGGYDSTLVTLCCWPPESCIWTCENPKMSERGKKVLKRTGSTRLIWPCGKCLPCIKLKTAKYEAQLLKDGGW